MTEYQSLLEQVNANTQAIEEIKQAIADMNSASAVANTVEEQLKDMQDQISGLQTRLAAIDGCTCNEEEVKQTIEALRVRITTLEQSPGVQASLNGTTLTLLNVAKED